MIASQTQPGDPPTANVSKTKRAAGRDNARQRCAAGIRRAQNAADAGSCNARDRNLMLLQHLKHTQVGETPREASTKGQTDARPGRRYRPFADSGLFLILHAIEDGNTSAGGQWAARSEKTVPMYFEKKVADVVVPT